MLSTLFSAIPDSNVASASVHDTESPKENSNLQDITESDAMNKTPFWPINIRTVVQGVLFLWVGGAALGHTSREIFAETMGYPETPYFYANLNWERYLTQEEFEKDRADYNDEEWESILQEWKNAEPFPVAFCSISYNIIYEITDADKILVSERENIYQNTILDMQVWLDEQSENVVFSDGFKTDFETKLASICSKYENEHIMLRGEVSNFDLFPDEENL